MPLTFRPLSIRSLPDARRRKSELGSDPSAARAPRAAASVRDMKSLPSMETDMFQVLFWTDPDARTLPVP